MPLPRPYRGPFCSELTRVVPTDEIADCVAASGIDIANAATLGVIPTGAPEREALRVDSGDVDGAMDLAHLRTGLSTRYGLIAVPFSTKAEILDALDKGFALVVIGRYDSLERNRRFQEKADFLHAMFFNRNDDSHALTTLFRADPLAGPTHKGGRMPRDVFLKFARSGKFEALGLMEGSARGKGGPNMAQTTVTLEPIQPPIEVRFVKGTHRFTATGRASSMKQVGTARVDARATIEQTDKRVPHGHGFLRLSSGGSAGFFVLEKEVTTGAAVPPGQDCLAATDPLNAQIDRLEQQLAALQPG